MCSACGNKCTYAYDAIGERQLTISPDGDRFTLTWDANQRLSRLVNPQALRTTFGYDVADRRTAYGAKNKTSRNARKFGLMEQFVQPNLDAEQVFRR